MKLTTDVSANYVEILGLTKVTVQFPSRSVNYYPCFNPLTGGIDMLDYEPEEIISVDGTIMGTEGYTYYPFNITINDRFRHEVDNYRWDSEYYHYINNLTEEVLREIDANINLRVGKWDILDYLSVLKVNLNTIRNGYYEIHNDNVETNCRKLNVNPRAKITTSDEVLLNTKGTTEWINYVLTDYWKMQMNSLDAILKYINEREAIIEKTDDYVKVIAEIPLIKRTLSWEANDTDLLELITALVESGSIQNSTKSLTRKEAIEFFSEIFGLEIKDAESKLSRATERKKDLSPFLTKLKQQFEKYVHKKDERTENLRK